MMDLHKIVFVDAEVDCKSKKVFDIGAVTGDGREFHSDSQSEFAHFIKGCEYICGHNILNHDLKYLEEAISKSNVEHFIDTLYFSPLLFPKKPYHRLVKDDKLVTDDLNNPLNDAKKARDLLSDEIAVFLELDEPVRQIYHGLLREKPEFKAFFEYLGLKGIEDIERLKRLKSLEGLKSLKSLEGLKRLKSLEGIEGLKPKSLDTVALIKKTFEGSVCANADVKRIAKKYPAELAYALAQINVIKYDSLTPSWVLRNYPRVENVLRFLRNKSCNACDYCADALNVDSALKKFFGFKDFRSYNGNPLQRDAVKAAVDGESILVVFPTGGGKSITFQLPALMAGVNEKGLTVVISPLQSLMKDQTDNLEQVHNITDAVTINSSLDPIERAKAFERIENGSAGILYISPESLRSRSIETLLLKRNVVRFVIDEAHCFSTWGQDFRVDYLYIADFINIIQEKKLMPQNIQVSCFTATAKKQVIEDIKDYFKSKLALELEVFRAATARANLNFHVFSKDDASDKELMLRELLLDNECPTIIYVSRVRKAEQLAESLSASGFAAEPYHGQMEKHLRVANQDKFMRGDINIIVATTAFGMGVDKKDVGMVIHYNISDSLENYIQESGRAGRDESIQADCHVLFSDEDLNKHFILLNQTRISQKEIRQVWKALKALTRSHASVSQSALEIARAAGWDDSVKDMETRVKTSINALEQAEFIRRGQNMPRIYADSILVKNMEEAQARIDNSARFDDESRVQAGRIIKTLLSAKSKARGSDEDGEDRVDYISDRLGIVKEDVIRVIGLLREERILADAKDLVAYIKKKDKISRTETILNIHRNIEGFLCGYLKDREETYNIKEMNEALGLEHENASIEKLGTILNYYDIKRLIKRTREYSNNYITLKPYFPLDDIRQKSVKRCRIAEVVIEFLYSKTAVVPEQEGSDDIAVMFSILELKEEFANNLFGENAQFDEIEDALYYLLKIGAIRIDGGFLVIYNAMRIDRLKKSNKTQYKKENYTQLDEYYKNKRQQIHIVGEYAKRLLDDYIDAMTFVDDYFVMEYKDFLKKYFKGRQEEIRANITPKKYKQLFGELSSRQKEIIDDKESKYIVVAAGPGSGKTKLLTHKLASLYIMEDVKHEQMLMLTFSRAAATEFKKRLMGLIGNAANFIQIMTFHSYCFDLTGKVGDLEKSDKIIEQTIEKINAGGVDYSRLTKSVLVIDEAQDMSEAEYKLVKTLMAKNEELRIIAVGDDDQNIYEFRGSDSKYFAALSNEPGAVKYELLDNYRSSANIVDFANGFASGIHNRLKKQPIAPVSEERGLINICKLASDKTVIPVVNAVIGAKPSGPTCIAARTNEEVMNIVGLLLQNGVPARQIQSNKTFNLYDLVEFRDFINSIDEPDVRGFMSDIEEPDVRGFISDIEEPDVRGFMSKIEESGGSYTTFEDDRELFDCNEVIFDDNYALSENIYTITDETWGKAKSLLTSKYESSANLPGVLKLIDDFEKVNNKTKYKSSLKQFIRESKIEDFIAASSDRQSDLQNGSQPNDVILVSTIHQTKGREFDNMFITYNRRTVPDDETRRAIYVALTRAKKNLDIFCCGDLFDDISAANCYISHDKTNYEMPSLITLQLSHEDVFLSYFKHRRKEIDKLISGQVLTVTETGCFTGDIQILKFSKKFCLKINDLKEKGYNPVSAVIRHIVYWKGEEMKNEIKIILPNVELQKLEER